MGQPNEAPTFQEYLEGVCRDAEKRGVKDMETFRAAIADNLSYHTEKRLTDDDLYIIRRFSAAVEALRSAQMGHPEPLPGDVVIMEGPKGVRHWNGRMEWHPWDKDSMHLCSHPMEPHVTKNGNVSTSGGPWVFATKTELRYDGEEEASFWTWGRHGSGGGNGVTFRAKVNRWHYYGEGVY
jgi:hypothetical protein